MFMIGSIISCLLALGCLAAGVGAVITQQRKNASSVSASGTVVELHKRVFKGGSAGVYCPTVRFSPPSGEVIQFESSFGTMPASYQGGQAVKVSYDPKDPHTAEIETGAADWLYPGCLLAFAGGAGLFSLLFLGIFLITSGSQ